MDTAVLTRTSVFPTMDMDLARYVVLLKCSFLKDYSL